MSNYPSHPTTCEIQRPFAPHYTQPAPPQAVPTELQCDLADTRTLIDQLYDRLAPALAPNLPVDMGQGAAIPLCELKCQILGCNDRLAEILRRLQI